MSLGYVWSAEYTIIGHTCLFGGLGGAFIVIYCLVKRLYVHKLEIFGTLLSILGCGIAIFDSSAAKMNSVNQNIPLGDFIASFSSLFLAVYFSLQGRYVITVPPFTLILILFIFASGVVNIFGVTCMPHFTLDMNPKTGIIGFLDP